MRRRLRGEDWGFVSGLVTAREAGMLPRSFFVQLLSETAPEGLVRRLSGTPLAERFRRVEDLHDVEPSVGAFYGAVFAEIRRFCPSPRVTDLLDLQHDFAAFKSFLKRRLMNLTEESPFSSRYGDEAWERLWTGLETELPPSFGDAAARARKALESASGRPDILDASVDSVALAALCDEAERAGSPFVAGYFRRYDTARGVEMLWRAQTVGADEGILSQILTGRQDPSLFLSLRRADEAEWPPLLASAMAGMPVEGLASATGQARIGTFVGAADDWLMSYLRDAKNVPFGPERVFGYLVGLEAESYNLRLVLGGRVRGISPERLQGRLRSCYL